MSDNRDLETIRNLSEIIKQRDNELKHMQLCREVLKYVRRHYSDTHPRVLKAEQMLKDSINAISWF